jgi:hypothetical protein
VLYLGDVPHHPINTNDAMLHSRMANGRAKTAMTQILKVTDMSSPCIISLTISAR